MQCRRSVETEKSASFWLLDEGHAVLGFIEDMMELRKNFCCALALAFKAELVHLKPAHSEDASYYVFP